MAQEEILDAKDVARYLRLHLFTVHKFAREGRLPAFKIGNDWRFRRASIDAWIEANENVQNREMKTRT